MLSSLSRREQALTLYIYGTSGMGKSAVVRHFLQKLVKRDRSVVILEGRCYERESVPYKALDGVIDSFEQLPCLAVSSQSQKR
jgi:Cdc6-like AAA superfamily ATPase